MFLFVCWQNREVDLSLSQMLDLESLDQKIIGRQDLSILLQHFIPGKKIRQCLDKGISLTFFLV